MEHKDLQEKIIKAMIRMNYCWMAIMVLMLITLFSQSGMEPFLLIMLVYVIGFYTHNFFLKQLKRDIEAIHQSILAGKKADEIVSHLSWTFRHI